MRRHPSSFLAKLKASASVPKPANCNFPRMCSTCQSLKHLHRFRMVAACIYHERRKRLEDLAGVISAKDVNAAILAPIMARRLDSSRVTPLQFLCMDAEMITESELSQWKHLMRLAQGSRPTEISAATHTPRLSPTWRLLYILSEQQRAVWIESSIRKMIKD